VEPGGRSLADLPDRRGVARPRRDHRAQVLDGRVAPRFLFRSSVLFVCVYLGIAHVIHRSRNPSLSRIWRHVSFMWSNLAQIGSIHYYLYQEPYPYVEWILPSSGLGNLFYDGASAGPTSGGPTSADIPSASPSSSSCSRPRSTSRSALSSFPSEPR